MQPPPLCERVPPNVTNESDDWQERWFARFEVRIDKRVDDFQKSVTDRLDSMEKSFREHVEKAGHSGDNDLRSRTSRLEGWAIGMLIGLLTTALGVLTELMVKIFGGKP